MSALPPATALRGSSPLTRGKPTEEDPHPYVLGLIPAHAGKTRWGSRPKRQKRAHPRSRGENLPDEMATCQAGGSSPLTRGKRPAHILRLHKVGLIPAHAGKTDIKDFVDAAAGAHPRSRGENHGALTPCETIQRLIPAHAGKTHNPTDSSPQTRAHPRSRGENPVFLEIPGKGTGSSLLTRGKRAAGADARAYAGLIPAHAGKTRRYLRRGR